MLSIRPTLPELRNRIAEDLELRYEQSGRAIDAKKAGLGYAELVNVLSGVAYSLWGACEHIAKQQIIETMDDETLIKVAGEYGLIRIPATYAQGTVNVVLTASGSALIPQGTLLQSDLGEQYQTLDNYSLSANDVQDIDVIALVPGAASNIDMGELSLVTPIANVEPKSTITAAVTGGTDIETIDRLRDRLRERKKSPPLGGKRDDYKAWAKQAHPDVTRAWVFEHENGVGSIVVRIVCEGLANPIPNSTVLNAVTDYIQNVRPAGLRSLAIEAPSPVAVDITFTALTPNTPEVQAAITAEIEDLLRREGAPDSTLLLSHIREAISRAAGEQDYGITLNSNLSFTASEFPVLGTLTFP